MFLSSVLYYNEHLCIHKILYTTKIKNKKTKIPHCRNNYKI